MNNNPGTITKILNGVNNTLNIANKVVPLYKEAKPMFDTVSKTFKTLKQNGNDIKKVIKLMNLKNEIVKNTNNNTISKETKLIKKDTYNNINNPKFFI